MPTSGTYNFNLTRDDVIKASLRLTTKFGAGETIPPEDIVDCATSLNILCKELATEGLPLWCVVEFSFPLVATQAVYDLKTLSGAGTPLKILDCYIRNPAGQDTTIMIESRYDYNKQGVKNSPGIPNAAYYDPQITAGLLTLHNVPMDALSQLHVIVQRPVQDFNLAVDNVDFPPEAYRLLKWCFADEISLEYSTPADVRREIRSKAQELRKNFFAYDQEQASVYFSPSNRRH